MKKLKTLLCCMLGLSIITVTAVTSAAAADEASTLFEGSMFIYEGAGENDLNIECPDGFERVPYKGGVAFKSKVTDIPDLTALTPDEHTEYVDGDFYIVDDVYVQDIEPDGVAVNSADKWERKQVTINRSIYKNINKNYGELYATMAVSALFKWNGETAEIVGTPGCITKIEPNGKGVIISKRDKKKNYASDQGSNAFWGNKYAYIEYIVTLTYDLSAAGMSSEIPMDFRLYVSVNRNGSINTED